MRELVLQDSQFIVATHSPILLAYPNARILVLDAEGYHETAYTDTEHYRITRAFLENPEEGVRRVFAEQEHE
jgi:predicted ATPase